MATSEMFHRFPIEERTLLKHCERVIKAFDGGKRKGRSVADAPFAALC